MSSQSRDITVTSFTPNGLEHKGPIRIQCSCGVTNSLCQSGGKKWPLTCTLGVSPTFTGFLHCFNALHVQNRRLRIKLKREFLDSESRASNQVQGLLSAVPCVTGCTSCIPVKLKPALSLAQHVPTALLPCSLTIPIPSTVPDSVSTYYLTE